MGVLEDEVAGGYGEGGVKGFVDAGDLEVAGAGKGVADLREKVRSWSAGRSSWSARWMTAVAERGLAELLLRRVTEGRAGATVRGRVRVRPSLREKCAVRRSPTRSWGAWLWGQGKAEVRWCEDGGRVLLEGVEGRCGGEGEVVDGEQLDLVETGAGEVGSSVAGVELEGLRVAGSE